MDNFLELPSEQSYRILVFSTEKPLLSTSNLAVCYDLKLKELSNRTTLVLNNTRELDRVPSTK